MAIIAAAYITRRSIPFLLLPFLMCGCGIFSTPDAPVLKLKHVRRVVQPSKTEASAPPEIEETIVYTPDAYVLHLSLAELTLEKSNPDITEISADMDIANTYAAQKQDGPLLQPIIILEYALDDHTSHRSVAIPFTMPPENNDFPGVKDAMARMAELPYTLHDIRIAVGSLPVSSPLTTTSDDANVMLKMIRERLQPFIKNANPMAPMVQARIDLQLTQFFMRSGLKEPAYLTIENAKQALAMVDESATGPLESTRILSDQIDQQESLLHQTMPFTFAF